MLDLSSLVGWGCGNLPDTHDRAMDCILLGCWYTSQAPAVQSISISHAHSAVSTRLSSLLASKPPGRLDRSCSSGVGRKTAFQDTAGNRRGGPGRVDRKGNCSAVRAALSF